MKKITLTKNQYAMVDDTEYRNLSKHKWQANKQKHGWYAQRSIRRNGKLTKEYMHRAIMKPEKGQQIDHIDHNGLNNQKFNLRIVTHRENTLNRKPYENTTSRCKGVFLNKQKNLWISQIKINGKIHVLGYFHAEKLAALAYDLAARRVFGEYAYTNNIPLPKKLKEYCSNR